MKKISRRDLLKMGAASGTLMTGAGRVLSQSVTYPFILQIECSGGWDQSMVFDNKVGSTVLQIDGSASLATGAGGINFVSSANRPSVDSYFNSHGAETTIVNGIFTRDLDHDLAQRRTNGVRNPLTNNPISFLTYYSTLTGLSKSYPHIISDVLNEADLYDVLTYKASLDFLKNADTRYLSGFGAATKSSLKDYLSKVYSRFSLGRINAEYDGRKVNTISSKALQESVSSSLLTANTLYDDTQPTNLRKRTFFALKMFEKGYSQAASVLDEEELSWDNHQTTTTSQNTNFERLFSDLEAIVDEAISLGIADNLIIVVKSEIGRDSRVSLNSKDHWPYTSCLIWSRQLTGGKVVGQTDDYLRGLKVDSYTGAAAPSYGVEVTFDSIYAAIFQKYGIDQKLLFGSNLIPGYFIL